MLLTKEDLTEAKRLLAKLMYKVVLPDSTKSIIIQTGRIIAQERRAQGLTQKELAKLARISRSSLANIETGRFALRSPAVARRYNRDVQKLICALEKKAQRKELT
jgi:DNA-binding XRE family transcriptional regulator